MPAKRVKKRLVIDTDIASSASGTSNPRSINCRQALDKILELKFRVVITPEIREEWDNHRSRYFITWLRKIFGKRLQVILSNDDVQNDKLREEISVNAGSEKDEVAMLKDVHLLEAALATDETILSMNSSDRERFSTLSEQVAIIREIAWVNPDSSEEECLTWLDNDAPADDFRKLGYREES